MIKMNNAICYILPINCYTYINNNLTTSKPPVNQNTEQIPPHPLPPQKKKKGAN